MPYGMNGARLLRIRIARVQRPEKTRMAFGKSASPVPPRQFTGCGQLFSSQLMQNMYTPRSTIEPWTAGQASKLSLAACIAIRPASSVILRYTIYSNTLSDPIGC
nr:hypothetical protein CFP56_20672 [Quercus suber]